MDQQSASLAGKHCLVTGATAGIGFITARELARRGARTTIVGRSAAKCADSVEAIRRATGSDAVSALVGDLSIQRDVRRVAQQYRDGFPRLDVLVNNAGALYLDRQVSGDGIELTFALNHLGYFLLTLCLLDLLRASAPARVVNVSSEAHRHAQLDFDDLQGARRYGGMRAYARSKLANLYFTYELGRRVPASEVTVNALHPGLVTTSFARNNGVRAALMWSLIRWFAITPEEGARTPVYLASSPAVADTSGEYFVKERPCPSSPISYDREAARQLWETSAEMVGT
jgi:retinol dehydrogenase-12